MTIRKGLPAKLAATDANDTRYDFRNLVACNADGSPRGGLTSPVGATVVSSTPTMNVAVAAFNAVAVRDGGVVFLANDGTQNVLLDAAPVANSRIDVIYAKQNDSSSTVTTPDANDTPVLTFAKGTAAASPTKPAIPAGAVELATVLIPAGATATNSSSPAVVITQTAQFTAGAGGVVPFPTYALLAAWTTAQDGQRAHVYAGTNALNVGTYRWSASSSRWLYADQQQTLAQLQLSGSTPVTNVAGAQDWINVGNVTVPDWSTSCIVDLLVAGVFVVTAATGNSVSTRVRIGSATAGSLWRLLDPNVLAQRWPHLSKDTITGLTAGSQALVVQSNYLAGSGNYRADQLSYVHALITWKP